ncbi:MAG: hypothetical protein ACXIT4_07375 [Erythrobacter sp.]
MISQLALTDIPPWLAAIQTEDDMEVLPLSGILSDCVFYPASGFDGRPVQFLAGHFHSFIYADYGSTKDELAATLEKQGFEGYHLLGRRGVSKEELTFNDLKPRLVPPYREKFEGFRSVVKPPFFEWMIFARDADRDETHGPARFSLLYLGADGVAAYQALFVANEAVPAAIAIIQPGHGFGGNWTNFENPQEPLYQQVRANPAGQPEFLLFGGEGGRQFYEQPCWPDYGEGLGFLGQSAVSLWRRARGEVLPA